MIPTARALIFRLLDLRCGASSGTSISGGVPPSLPARGPLWYSCFTLQSYLQSVTNPPHSGGSGKSPQPYQNGGQGKQCKWDGNARVSGEVSIQSLKDLVGEYKAAQEQSASKTNKQIALNTLTFVAVALTLLATTWQARETRKSAIAAQRQARDIETQFQMSERPLVRVDDVKSFILVPDSNKTRPMKPVKIDRSFDPGELGGVTVEYSNIGHTAALRVVEYRHLVYGTDGLKSIAPDPVGDRNDAPDIFPNDHKMVSVMPLKKESGEDSYFVDPSNTLPFNGQYPITAYGEIIYGDTFGNTYCTPFIRVWTDQNATQWVTPGSVSTTDENKKHTANELCPKDSIR